MGRDVCANRVHIILLVCVTIGCGKSLQLRSFGCAFRCVKCADGTCNVIYNNDINSNNKEIVELLGAENVIEIYYKETNSKKTIKKSTYIPTIPPKSAVLPQRWCSP